MKRTPLNRGSKPLARGTGLTVRRGSGRATPIPARSRRRETYEAELRRQKVQVHALKPDDPDPLGSPREYYNAAGYLRLRWRIGPYQYVERYARDDDGRLVRRGVSPRKATLDMERAIALYERGESTIEIGRALGVSPSHLSRSLRAHGVRMRTKASYARHLTPDDKAEIVRRYDQELLDPSVLAKEFLVGPVQIRRVLRESQIMRPAGRRKGESQVALPADEVVRLYTADRWSLATLARHYDVSLGPVRRILVSRGVLRPPGGSKGMKARRRDTYEAEFRSRRPAVRARAGNRCEIGIPGVCTGSVDHVHHRKMRSQGGTNDLCNLLALCLGCHSHVHHHAGVVAYENGWLVHAGSGPSRVPVSYRGAMVCLLLLENQEVA